MHPTQLVVVVAMLTAGADLTSKTAAETLRDTVLSQPAYNQGLVLQVVSLGPWLQAALALAGAVVCAWVMGRWVRRGLVPGAPVGLIIGGCLGNAADRLALGEVRDFLVLGPVVANVADLALVAGLAWCIAGAARALTAPPLLCDERQREGAADAVLPGVTRWT